MEGAATDGPEAAKGALARVSPAAVLDALRLPQSGRVYDLGLELNDRIPSNPAFTPLSLQFTHRPDESGKGSPFQFSADTFTGGLHIGTHMDAFVHVQAENRVFGGAAILGSVVAAAYGPRLPRYLVYVVCFLLAGVPRYVVLAVAAPWAVIIGVCVLGGFASGFLNPLLGAVLFERIPERLMGRVTAMNLAMSWSLIPFGGILGGVLIAASGVGPALLIVGGAYFVTTMAPALQPRWRELDDRSPLREELDVRGG